MRVLIVMTTTFDISGITNSVMNYYRYMDKSDMSVDFVAPNSVPTRLKQEIEENGGKIFELLGRTKHPYKYMNRLKNIICDGNYDIVHAHGNSCTLAIEMYAAKQAGCKIRIAHSRNTTSEHMFFHKVLRPVFDRLYTHGFACGKDAGKWLFKDKEFTVITNGNDIEKFAFNEQVRDEYRNKYNLEGKKVIGHVGYFTYQKNHAFIIEIFDELVKKHDDYMLILVGDGSLRPSIEEKIESLGLQDKVVCTGKSLEVEKILQAMDIMLLPSWYEGLPNVVIEWQIAGLPCLISDRVTSEVKLTDLVEFIPLEAGAKEWAAKINQTDRVDRDKIKEHVISQISLAGFNVKENAIELKKLYVNLIAGQT